MADVFDRLRGACRTVAESAGLVRIDHERLLGWARSAEGSWFARGPCAPTPGGSDEEAVAAFVLALDAVNFGSGWFPVLRKPPGTSGHRAIEAGLRAHVERAGPPTTAWLAEADATRCARLFGQDPAGPTGELMERYAAAWRDLALHVDGSAGGSFAGCVRQARSSAETLVAQLGRMPAFDDVARYRGFDVPFYKRAQIAVYDLRLAFGDQGPGRFTDRTRLTMFADNLVPHVLRVDGILRYDGRLADRIDRGALIASGSEAEVEIRAVALHAVELLVAELGRLGHEVDAAGLDTVLWSRGAGPRYKAIPRHRTRCTYY